MIMCDKEQVHMSKCMCTRERAKDSELERGAKQETERDRDRKKQKEKNSVEETRIQKMSEGVRRRSEMEKERTRQTGNVCARNRESVEGRENVCVRE